MAAAAREAMNKRRLQALADRGYYNAREINACTEAGINAPSAQADDLQRQGRGSLQQG